MSFPIVIIGAGLAGVSAALSLAPAPVVLIGRKPAHKLTSSELAQGGIAASIDVEDSAVSHTQDTMKAGAFYNNKEAVSEITASAPDAIWQLEKWGVRFDHKADGSLDLGLEGAHEHRRIVHAGGDATGALVMEALMDKALKTPSITFVEGEAQRIETDADDVVCAVLFYDKQKEKSYRIQTDQIVLATGSAGALWQDTTVPSLSWGHGLWLAAQAGAQLKDLEFAQFHPTALDVGIDPLPLVSEAVRGEGAFFVNELGDRFVPSLAARDIVARAVFAQREAGHKTYLDARTIKAFEKHFPTVFEACTEAGLHPSYDLIPIKPVTHYHMGGIATDVSGRTNVQGLWACGECACTGLHGANRLASNSLLEAVVMGQKMAQQLGEAPEARVIFDEVDNNFIPNNPEEDVKVRAIMSAYVGVCRTQRGLEQAVEVLKPLQKTNQKAQVALMIARAALRRPFSLGAHERSDTADFNRRLAC